jgi:hypothetical protein
MAGIVSRESVSMAAVSRTVNLAFFMVVFLL